MRFLNHAQISLRPFFTSHKYKDSPSFLLLDIRIHIFRNKFYKCLRFIVILRQIYKIGWEDFCFIVSSGNETRSKLNLNIFKNSEEYLLYRNSGTYENVQFRFYQPSPLGEMLKNVENHFCYNNLLLKFSKASLARRFRKVSTHTPPVQSFFKPSCQMISKLLHGKTTPMFSNIDRISSYSRTWNEKLTKTLTRKKCKRFNDYCEHLIDR